MFSTFPRVQALALALILPGCSATSSSDGTSSGPAYSPAHIYRFAFQGIHLGMPFDEACRTLRSLGYVLRTVEEDRRGCDANRVLQGDFDGWKGVTFFGIRPTTGLPPLRSDAPAQNVRFFSLSIDDRRGRPRVVGISIDTAEPNRRTELAELTAREWGRPTFFADYGYTVLGYGQSRRQVDGANRDDFDSCRFRPQCARRQERLDCDSLLTEFSTAYARTVAYDWGRHIEIEDQRANPEVQDILRRRAWEGGGVCAVPMVH